MIDFIRDAGLLWVFLLLFDRYLDSFDRGGLVPEICEGGADYAWEIVEDAIWVMNGEAE